MLRPLAALAAVAAFAAPGAADAVIRCQSVNLGFRHVLGVCVGADTGLDHTTVDPTVYWGCTIGDQLACTGEPINVGRTGVEQGSGTIWVAGAPVILQ